MPGLTLAAPATAALEVKHSRFVAHAAPVESAEHAMSMLEETAARDATHNCWAYRVGAQYRFNDDGEPSGTAGRPILAAIDAHALDGVLVVVARWYGGVKLGAGGLVRAYGGCAAQCLRDAPTRQLVALATIRLRFGFGDTGAVHSALLFAGAARLRERFDGEGVELELEVPADRVDALKVQLRDATRDRVRLTELVPHV